MGAALRVIPLMILIWNFCFCQGMSQAASNFIFPVYLLYAPLFPCHDGLCIFKLWSQINPLLSCFCQVFATREKAITGWAINKGIGKTRYIVAISHSSWPWSLPHEETETNVESGWCCLWPLTYLRWPLQQPCTYCWSPKSLWGSLRYPLGKLFYGVPFDPPLFPFTLYWLFYRLIPLPVNLTLPRIIWEELPRSFWSVHLPGRGLSRCLLM